MAHSESKFTRSELALGLTIAGVVLLFVMFIIVRSNYVSGVPPQRCPIDGLPAEWQTDGERGGSRRDHNVCNYGHFSKVDQKPHTWWAACQ
jgi:hypothetical protein